MEEIQKRMTFSNVKFQSYIYSYTASGVIICFLLIKFARDLNKLCVQYVITGWSISSDSWVGLTLIYDVLLHNVIIDYQTNT